ncbi:hypothetical protein [Pinibacter soli]|uniref:TonB-dependent receptor plug domain-containing protein n=1 Tax=Pinibacter soli TaxID=3044211 RepID=A0ABT6RK23_9BACT|nr:hypothetical protein [Pinibacter soli]MDI3322244.1 hypothetical protein [Pinibacter soli]
MIQKLIKSLTIVCLLIIPGRMFAQRLDSLMTMYSDRYPIERAHVHFDKNYYNAGETIWFKAYLMTGLWPSTISTNMYFELIDDNGNVLNTKVAPVLESSAIGSFDIAPTYTKSVLYVKAYTRWMLNFDTTFLFTKAIKIINKNTSGKPERATSISLRFFPEGGDMVNGVESVVAFKAIDNNGYPVNINGNIMSSSGQKVAAFKSIHDGMGSVTLTPQANTTYKAVWKDVFGKDQSVDLPAAKASGAVIKVSDGLDTKNFTIKRSTGGGDALNTMHIVAMMNQQVVYMANLHVKDGADMTGEIPSTQLPSCIMQLTLFDADWKPVAERITFVDNNDYQFDANVRKKSIQLTKRGKNEIDIEVDDTVKSNLSVSVTDADVYQPKMEDDNIISRFLLTSELRGNIYRPYYYFSNPSDSVKNHRDLLMLTNGWRRYNWDKIMAKNFPSLKYQPDKFLSLNGQAYGVSQNRFKKGEMMNAILQMPDSSKQMFFLELDSTGSFNTQGLVFFGKANLYYTFNKNSALAERASLRLDNGLVKGNAVEAIDKNLLSTVSLPDSSILHQSYLVGQGYINAGKDRDKKTQTLQEVVVKGKVRSEKDKLDDKYANGLFKGGDGYSFDPANDPFASSAYNIFTYLQGKVPGLMINQSGGATTLTWRGGTPGLYLDEISTDADQIQNIPMTDVAYIKVFRPPFMGMGGGNGGIAIYTKRGGGASTASIKGLESSAILGYSEIKEFSSPNYAVESPLDAIDDLRTTLYWKPYILLDKVTKRATIQFYNNDITKKLRITIEGVSETGKLMHTEEIIQ